MFGGGGGGGGGNKKKYFLISCVCWKFYPDCFALKYLQICSKFSILRHCTREIEYLLSLHANQRHQRISFSEGNGITILMLSMLGKIFSRRHWKYFSYFSQKIGFEISCKSGNNFAWALKYLYYGWNEENIIDLSSAEFAQRVVKVKLVIVKS